MKKAFLVISLLLTTAIVWYLFIKPHDYLVKFTEKTSTGYIFNVIKEWNSTHDNSTIIDSKRYSEIQQKIQTEQNTYILTWDIDKLNDSLSTINLFVTEPEHSLKNRISMIFTKSDVAIFSKTKGLELKEKIESQLSKSRVRLDGMEQSPSKFCACVQLRSTRKEKAEAMITNKYIVPEFLEKNRIPITDYPLLEIEKWDQRTDSITFNFCFPVKQTDSLPADNQIFYKTFQTTPSLKSTFYGNYRVSDQAWFALLDFARTRDLSISELPIEIYYNNPHNGGNEIDWKAEIFMPLQ